MSKVLLILGSGSRIGQATAFTFAKAGYKVVLASRTDKTEKPEGAVHLKVDLSDPTSIAPLFDQVEAVVGSSPSVVVYNASGMAREVDGNPVTNKLNEFTEALNINTVSAYEAAAVGLRKNSDIKFLYTGNATNTRHFPNLTSLGIGKTASAYWISAAADIVVKNGEAARYYYVDQRKTNGDAVYNDIDGQGHADVFLKLAEQKEQSEAILTFVSEKFP